MLKNKKKGDISSPFIIIIIMIKASFFRKFLIPASSPFMGPAERLANVSWIKFQQIQLRNGICLFEHYYSSSRRLLESS